MSTNAIWLGASKPQFTPNNIANLVGWWDPDTNLTYDPVTLRVSSWVDRVNGISAAQATGASQPSRSATFHGRASVLYGSSRFLSGSFPAGTFALGTPFTICAAIRVGSAAATSGAVFDSSPTTSTNSGNMVFYESNAWKLRQFSPLTDISWATSPQGTEIMLAARGTTTSRALFTNNVSRATGSTTVTLPAVSNFQFGILFGNIYSFGGYTGDIAIYNRSLTDAELSDLYTQFFKPRWGV